MKFEKHNKVSFLHQRYIPRIRNYLNSVGNLSATDLEIEAAWIQFSNYFLGQNWIETTDMHLKVFADWLQKHCDEIEEES